MLASPVLCQETTDDSWTPSLSFSSNVAVTETIIVDTPKAGEVRVKVMANALCHTDGECQAEIQLRSTFAD